MSLRIKQISGLSLLCFMLLWLLSACGKTRSSYIVRGDFNYINETGKDIILRVRGQMVNGSTLQTFSLLSNDTLMLHLEGETDFEDAEPFGYVPPLSGDTTTVQTSDTLCYREYNRTGALIQNIRAYSYTKLGRREYRFYYTIDSNLTMLATRCQ